MKFSRYSSWLLVIGAFLLSSLLYGRIVIQNDGITYYALTLSLLQDGDYDLSNQRIAEVRLEQGIAAREKGSKYSGGFAVLYAPFVFVTEQLSRILPGLAVIRPYSQNARFPFSQTLGIFLGSVAYGLLTVVIGTAVIMKLYGTTSKSAALLNLALFTGSPLLFYSIACPSFPHASDAFLTAIAFALVVLPFSTEPKRTRYRNLLFGFVLALSLFLRNNNIILFVIFGVAYVLILRKSGTGHTFQNFLEILLGALPVLTLHVYFNFEQYGSLFATGYRLKASMNFLMRLRYLGYVFFHPIAGIFVNNPVTILAVFGLIIGIRQGRREAMLAAISVIAVLLSLSYVGYIYPGSAFGQRLMTHLYIFWAIGLYHFIRSFRKIGIAMTVLFVTWSFLLMNLYFICTAQREFRNWNERGYDPFLMIEVTVKLYDSSGLSPFQLWQRSLAAPPYPTILPLLLK